MPRPQKKSMWGYVVAGVVGFALSYVLNPAKDFVVDVFKSGPEITRTINIDNSELNSFIANIDDALQNVTTTAQQSPELEELLLEFDSLKEDALKDYNEAVKLLKSNLSGSTAKAVKKLRDCLETLEKTNKLDFESKGASKNTANRIKKAVSGFMTHINIDLLDQPMVLKVAREKSNK